MVNLLMKDFTSPSRSKSKDRYLNTSYIYFYEIFNIHIHISKYIMLFTLEILFGQNFWQTKNINSS
jgi:hypothetical protein